MDQREAPADFVDRGASWYQLDGSFDVAGTTLVVRLSDDANPPGSTTVVADAIRIERIDGPDALEPNNSFETAADLGTGDQTYHHLSIDSPDDRDYYRWVAAQNGQLTVDALFSHADGDLDLRLYDAERVLLELADSQGNIERVQHTVTAGSLYFIHVYGFGGATNDDYSLSIDEQP